MQLKIEEKTAAAALDGRTIKARQWFKSVRHQLRHGESEQVIAQLEHRFSNTKNYFFGYSDNEISAFENSRNPKYGLDSEY